VPVHTRFPELMAGWHDNLRLAAPTGEVDLHH